MTTKKYIFAILFFGTLLFTNIFLNSSIYAQTIVDQDSNGADQQTTAPEYKEESLEGQIIGILEQKKIIPEGGNSPQLYQKLEISVTKGSLKGKKIIVETGNLPSSNLPVYKKGDKIIISYSKDAEGHDTFYITDFIRRDSLAALFLIFIILTILIGKWRGLTSILGMGMSFSIIFLFILPKILSGNDPILITVIGSLFIIPTTFYLSHGFNKKTSIAIAGTLIALVITAILANIFVEATKLTGFASEEAGFLQDAKSGLINIKGLLLAGIIIGTLGVLDDITISQSAIVFQLKQANPKIRARELYKRAMNVGQDHIASMVNTLILVYTGAALPLLLLFINNPHPFSEVTNYEIVADEIVRTLVGSIGLVLAVPITTLLSSMIADKKI